MERKQKGEQFQVIDRAQIPKRPIEPDLKRILMMALAIGFGLGGSLAYLFEYTDSTYRKPDKIEEDFKIPVIAAIPELENPSSMLRSRIEVGICSLFALVTLLLIGSFSYIAFLGNDKTMEVIKNYLSI